MSQQLKNFRFYNVSNILFALKDVISTALIHWTKYQYIIIINKHFVTFLTTMDF